MPLIVSPTSVADQGTRTLSLSEAGANWTGFSAASLFTFSSIGTAGVPYNVTDTTAQVDVVFGAVGPDVLTITDNTTAVQAIVLVTENPSPPAPRKYMSRTTDGSNRYYVVQTA